MEWSTAGHTAPHPPTAEPSGPSGAHSSPSAEPPGDNEDSSPSAGWSGPLLAKVERNAL